MAFNPKRLTDLFRLSKKKVLNVGKAAKTPAVFGAGAAIGGFSGGAPGHRTDSAREGLIGAALAGVVGTVIFRRVRGRIVPIRVKK